MSEPYYVRGKYNGEMNRHAAIVSVAEKYSDLEVAAFLKKPGHSSLK